CDSKHVVDFALQPVRRRPDADRTSHTLPICDQRLYPNTLVALVRIKDPDKIKLLFPFWIVNSSDVHAVVKIVFVAQNDQDIGNNRRTQDKVVLSQIGACFTDSRSVTFFKIIYQWRIPQSRDWPSGFWRRRVRGLLLAVGRGRLDFVWHSYERYNLQGRSSQKNDNF